MPFDTTNNELPQNQDVQQSTSLPLLSAEQQAQIDKTIENLRAWFMNHI